MPSAAPPLSPRAFEKKPSEKAQSFLEPLSPSFVLLFSHKYQQQAKEEQNLIVCFS